MGTGTYTCVLGTCSCTHSCSSGTCTCALVLDTSLVSSYEDRGRQKLSWVMRSRNILAVSSNPLVEAQLVVFWCLHCVHPQKNLPLSKGPRKTWWTYLTIIIIIQYLYSAIMSYADTEALLTICCQECKSAFYLMILVIWVTHKSMQVVENLIQQDLEKLIVVSAQYLPSDGLERLLMTSICGEEITSTKPRWKRLFICILSLIWFVYVAVCFPRPYTIYIFHTSWHDRPIYLFIYIDSRNTIRFSGMST